MSKVNSKSVSNKVVNHGGVLVSLKDAAQQFYELCVGSMYGTDNYYESNSDKLSRLENIINSLVTTKDGCNFVANVIVYARKNMHIRTMPLVATILFAKALRNNGNKFCKLRGLVRTVISRADELTDMYAIALVNFIEKGKVPISVKRGIADAFNKFDAYQLTKYRAANKAVKLKDVIKLVHPKPLDEDRTKLYKGILEDSVAPAKTWEYELSTQGQIGFEVEGKTKAEIWTDLITNKKLGYMAALRNLRNILKADVDNSTIDLLVSYLTNPKAVENSKQFPFSFYNAYTAVKDLDCNNTNQKYKVITAIKKAMDISCRNIPKLGENVWIIVDTSGSMSGFPATIASLMSCALLKANKDSSRVRVTQFSSEAKHVNLDMSKDIFSMHEDFSNEFMGGGTNLDSAFKLGFGYKESPDVIIVFSDMEINQCLNGNRFNSSAVPNAEVKIAINLHSNSTTPIGPQAGFLQLAGFSEKLFDLIPVLKDSEKTVKKFFSQEFLPE